MTYWIRSCRNARIQFFQYQLEMLNMINPISVASVLPTFPAKYTCRIGRTALLYERDITAIKIALFDLNVME